MVLNFKGSNDLILKTTQSDFDETDTGSISFIENKPSGNQILDWTTDQGSTNIHSSNIQSGIGDGNILKCNANVSNNDYLKIDGTSVEGKSTAELITDIGGSGIGDGNILKCNSNVSDNDYLKIDGTSVEGRTITELKQDLSLEDSDIHTIMEDIVKYTENSGGATREIELITPSDAIDGGHPAFTCITIKPNGITLPNPFSTTFLTSNTIASNNATDLSIQRGTTEKVSIENTEIIFKDDVLIDDNVLNVKGRVSIYDDDNDKSHAIPLFVGRKVSGTINGGSWQGLHWAQSGVVSAGSNTWVNNVSIYGDGVIMTNNWSISTTTAQTSDDRLKSEEVKLENGTDTILKLEPKIYQKHRDYMVEANDESAVDKDTSGNVIEKYKEIGLIAQDVLKIPELEHIVVESPNFKNECSTYAVNYTQLIPVLCKSIQELNERIVELESKQVGN